MIDPKKRARIKWRCRRGMLELDLLLEKFVQNELDTLSQQQLAQFERLLEYPDPVLNAVFMGESLEADEELNDFVQWMQQRISA